MARMMIQNPSSLGSQFICDPTLPEAKSRIFRALARKMYLNEVSPFLTLALKNVSEMCRR
jgi:hypothetical protein